MLFKKTKKMLVLQITALLLIFTFAIVMGACSDDVSPGGKVPIIETPGGETPDGETPGGETPGDETPVIQEPPISIDHLTWGIEANANVKTLGLTPGNNTTEIRLNWYSTGSAADRVAKVRFIRGTLAQAYEVLEVSGSVSTPDASSAATGNTIHKAEVNGLKPGASYVYAVSSDGINWSKEYDFKVPATTGAFKFAVIADPQLNARTATTGDWDLGNRYTPAGGAVTLEGWKETVAIMVSKGISFIATAGDLVDNVGGSLQETEYEWFFTPPGLRNIPLAPVSGNHDAHALFDYHFNYPNKQTFGDENNLTYGNGRNYYYLYNNILFVVLNTAPYPTNKAGADPHIVRFKSTIQAAKAAHAGKYNWLIVQHHKSTASVANHLDDTDIQYYVEAGFEKLMSDENVDFVLAGHDHVYARSYPLQGKGDGYVSMPVTTFPKASGSTWTNPGNPVYLTFTTGSGLKYYQVSMDPYINYTDSPGTNTNYPYLGVLNADGELDPDKKGSAKYYGSKGMARDGMLPISNAAFFQPYIPSYTIVDVDGKIITFRTYAIATKSGWHTTGEAALPVEYQTNPDYKYNIDANVPYDVITVTKN